MEMIRRMTSRFRQPKMESFSAASDASGTPSRRSSRLTPQKPAAAEAAPVAKSVRKSPVPPKVGAKRQDPEQDVDTDEAEEEGQDAADDLEAGDEDAKAEESDDDMLGPDGEELNEYERERARIIKRNKAMMASLNLTTMAAGVEALAPKPARRTDGPQKGIKRAKRVEAVALPRRASSRLRGVQADGAVVGAERRDGTLVLLDATTGALIPTEVPPDGVEEPAGRRRMPEGPLPMASVEGTAASDEEFLAALKGAAALPAATGEDRPLDSVRGYAKRMSKLKLLEEDVAKMVQKSATFLGFLPRGDMLAVACADKGGQVSVWRVDHDAAVGGAGAGEEEASDGVHTFRPHMDYLITSSYDGTIRRMDVQAGAFAEAYRPRGEDEGREISSMAAAGGSHVLYIGDTDGEVAAVDLRACGAVVQSWQATQPRGKNGTVCPKVNSVSVHPDGHVVASASQEGLVNIWDARLAGGGAGGKKQKKPLLAALDLPKSIQNASFSPSGSKLLTTCFDDTLRVFSGAGGAWKEARKVKHDNQTGRWVMPFKAVWGATDEAFLVGSMRRQLEVVDAASGEYLARHTSEHMTAIPSRNAAHPTRDVVAAGTASGRVHIFR